jgi:hypothetical protein
VITERMQKHYLCKCFISEEMDSSELTIDDWTNPWREILLMAERNDHITNAYGQLYAALRTVVGDETLQDVMNDIRSAGEPLTFPNLAEIADNLKPIRWLWPNWVPRGMLSILGAYQGTGKSYLVLDLARTVIHGGPWPDGTLSEQLGKVLYVEAESVPQITNERAIGLGLDRRQLWLMMPDNGELLDLTQTVWRDRLLDMALTIKPELIIIDSLTSISSAGQNSVEDTNRLLMFLVGIARELDCGLLVLHHLRKPGGGQLSLPGMSLHDFRGSSHITAMARTVLGLNVIQNGRQFSLNGPRRLDLVKTNLGSYPEGIGIEMQREEERVKFVYGKAPSFDQQESPADNCEEWLLEYLEENGPSRPADVLTAAEEKGFTTSTVYRVRKRLNDAISNTCKNFRAPDNKWSLVGDEDTADDDEESNDE